MEGENEKLKWELSDSRAETESWKEKGEVTADRKVENLQKMVEVYNGITERMGNSLWECGNEKIHLQRELARVTEKAKWAAAEYVGMGGTGSPSQKIMVNATTNTETETKTYAQAAAQTQVKVPKEQAGGKEKGPRKPAVTSEVSAVVTSLPHRFPFVEDLSEYEEEGDVGRNGTMTKAVVVHRVPPTGGSMGNPDCAGRIMGEVIGVSWLLSEGRRIGRTASSVVVYLQTKSTSFLGLEAFIKMLEKRHSVVAYRWRA